MAAHPPMKSARAAARGEPCDDCCGRCGSACWCDCHWEDTNLLSLPPEERCGEPVGQCRCGSCL